MDSLGMSDSSGMFDPSGIFDLPSTFDLSGILYPARVFVMRWTDSRFWLFLGSQTMLGILTS